MMLSMKWATSLVTFCTLLCMTGCQPPARNRGDTERAFQVLNADRPLSLRQAQLACRMSSPSPEVLRAIALLVGRQREPIESLAYLDAMSAVGQPGVRALAEGLGAAESSEVRLSYLIGIGLMGPSARDMASLIKEEAAKHGPSSLERVAAALVLANAGIDTDSAEELLSTQLKEAGIVRERVLLALALMGVSRWVSDDTQKQLGAIVSQGKTVEERCWAALALANCGLSKRWEAVIEGQLTRERELAARILLNAALAKATGGGALVALQRAVRMMGEDLSRTEGYASLVACHALLRHPLLVDSLGKMLRGDDEIASLGALRCAGMVGLPANSLQEDLLGVLRGNRNDRLKGAAVVALASVAESGIVHRLKGLRSQVDDRIRGQIARTTAILECRAEFPAPVSLRPGTMTMWSYKLGQGKSPEAEQIARRVGVSARDDLKWTPLHAAAAGPSIASVRILLARGAKVDARDDERKTPLYLAAARGNHKAVRMLLDAGAEIDAQDSVSEFTPLVRAVMNGHDQVVDELLRRGANAQYTGAGWTLLHYAAGFKGTARTIEMLLDHGLDVDARDGDGNTPLDNIRLRSDHGSSKAITEFLIEKGADIHASDKRGYVPLHGAAGSGAVGMLDVLLEKGANVNVRSEAGEIPLHLAAHMAACPAATRLIEAGAQVNSQAKNGETPLHYAARGWAKDTQLAKVITLLLKHGANPDIKDKAGRTPLDVAKRRLRGNAAILRALAAPKPPEGRMPRHPTETK
jgi:ankyrin repeat protein